MPAEGIQLDDAWASLFPARELVRGTVIGCVGPAAITLAIALVTRQVDMGSWVAVVGVPDLGVEAAAELGVPLHRLVGVKGDAGVTGWAERVTAAADGFDLIVTSPPPGAHRLERRVAQRIRSRGALLLAVGGGMSTEFDVGTEQTAWVGASAGAGRLTARRAIVRVSGRRVHRPRRAELWLPGVDGRIVPVEESAIDPAVNPAIEERMPSEWSRAV